MTRCALEKPEGFTAMTRCALQFLRLLLRKVQLYGVRRQFYDWKLNFNEISIAWGVIGFHSLFPAMGGPHASLIGDTYPESYLHTRG